MIIHKKSYAKINLSLKILRKLPSGYHELYTVMQRISLCDNIKVEITEGDSGIKINCTNPSLADSDNIAYKAADLFLRTVNTPTLIGVNIDIEKNIPLQAGLGGGSSNAAAVLLALNEYLSRGGVIPPADTSYFHGRQNAAPTNDTGTQLRNLWLSEHKLMELAAKIGADVPFFVSNLSCAICEGIGEKITPHNHDLSGCVLIVKPIYGISTRQAFEDWDNAALCRGELCSPVENNQCGRYIAGEQSSPLQLQDRYNFKNDFSALAFNQNANLREICDIMLHYGANQAELTGSGSALFGIFTNFAKAQECEANLRRHNDVQFCGIFDFV